MKDVNKYPFMVKMENDGNNTEYVVIFQDFKNIIGSGSTINDAVKEARENLEAYFDYCQKENIDIPEPSDDDWMESFNGKITLRMPKSLHRDISEYASNDGLSLNSVINDAIRLYLTMESIKTIQDRACQNIDKYAYETKIIRMNEEPRNAN